MTAHPSDNSNAHSAQKQSPLGQPQTVEESSQSTNAEGEPLPSEVRLFVADLRELFREIKKLIIFLRNRRNTNALLVALTFALAIATFTQALIYWLQLRPLRDSAGAAKSQTELLSKQLEEANKAILLYDKPFNLTAPGQASFGMRNLGHYTAAEITATVVIALRNVSSNQTAATFTPPPIRIPDIPGPRPWIQDPSRDPNSYYEWTVPYTPTRQQESLIKNGDLAVTAELSFSYSNGFRNVNPPSECFAAITLPLIHLTPQQTIGPWNSTPHCDLIVSEYNNLLEERARYKKIARENERKEKP